MRVFLIIVIAIIFIFVSYSSALAQPTYVLPYPSSMPGSRFYVFHRVWEEVARYWYFGNFSQFVYNLKLSDKYLVETKTLFEYKQYLFAYEALERSDIYFIRSNQFLEKARREQKNTSLNSTILKEAAKKHIEVLKQIRSSVPEQFEWSPEKEQSKKLFLWKKINEAIEVRNKIL